LRESLNTDTDEPRTTKNWRVYLNNDTNNAFNIAATKSYMLDLNDLKLFHDIVKAGGFSAAHRITGQSRATLSRHLNALEDKLGTRLIERSTRSFRLTEPGKSA